MNFEEYRYLWNLVSRKPFLTSFPIHLDLELTARCNLKCKMCFQNYMLDTKSIMSEELFKNIIDEGTQSGLCSIKLQSRGESMMHPKIVELLGYAKEKGVLDVHLTTNGLLLKGKKLDGLVEAGLDLLILSYDRDHAEAAHMTEDDYTKLMQNVVKTKENDVK